MFIALQHSVSMELISRLAETDLRRVDVNIQRYPHPAYTSDLAVQLLIAMFPFFILLSFCYSAINIVRAVTIEKELQLKVLVIYSSLSSLSATIRPLRDSANLNF